MTTTNLPVLKIGNYQPKYPIIQGGMGVMISGPRLAAAVASAGGVGTLASVGLAATLPNYTGRGIVEQNKGVLKKFIAQAKEESRDGVVAVNCMCALTDYEIQIRTACEAGVDVIISGAGLPLKLPELTADYPEVALVPIVSSVKAADLIIRRWSRWNKLPDAFVVETPNTAGGHLGARDEIQAMDPDLSLEKVIPELTAWLAERDMDIPVIAAGGIWDREDMLRAFELGARGVQMGTRFAASKEGDASDRFKQAYVEAKAEDVVLIQSPCGLPGRALRSPMIERYLDGTVTSVPCSANCLSHCRYRKEKETFCIAEALINAYRGDWERGLFFCGSNVWKVKSIQPVADILGELVTPREELLQATAF